MPPIEVFFMRTIPDRVLCSTGEQDHACAHSSPSGSSTRPARERDILELPVRCDRLNIINPVRTSHEYAYSVSGSCLINQQDPDITKLNLSKIKEKKEELMKKKEEFLFQRFRVRHKESDHQLKTHLETKQERREPQHSFQHYH